MVIRWIYCSWIPIEPSLAELAPLELQVVLSSKGASIRLSSCSEQVNLWSLLRQSSPLTNNKGMLCREPVLSSWLILSWLSYCIYMYYYYYTIWNRNRCYAKMELYVSRAGVMCLVTVGSVWHVPWWFPPFRAPLSAHCGRCRRVWMPVPTCPLVSRPASRWLPGTTRQARHVKDTPNSHGYVDVVPGQSIRPILLAMDSREKVHFINCYWLKYHIIHSIIYFPQVLKGPV